jgi:hypothetical protein
MAAIVCATGVFMQGLALGEEPESEADARAAINPIAHRYKLPLEADFDPDIGPYQRLQFTLQAKPVLPVRVTSQWALIFRAIVPLQAQPDVDSPSGTTWGLQDTLVTCFLSPIHPPPHLSLGLGPALLVPTATSSVLGPGRWAAGPSFAIVYEPTRFTVGVLVNNVWSLGGDLNRQAVNELQIEYVLELLLADGWFLSASPTITADWERPPQQRWTVPVGGGIGRAFDWGGPSLAVTLEAFANVARPEGVPTAPWQLHVNAEVVFPKMW